MLRSLLEQLRAKRPLIHCITNYVAANACANILLACGASPVMACHPQETAEVAAACDGLCLNLGTMHEETLPAMLSAGRAAAAHGHPILLDPVGAGASSFRQKAALTLLGELPIAAIRGNVSELFALAGKVSRARGVDSGKEAAGIADTARELSLRTGAVVAATGAADVVVLGERLARIRNGHPMMRYVTGTGCQLSAMATAYLAANGESAFEAMTAALCAMGVCGEIAYERLDEKDGSMTYGNYIIDAVYRLTPEELERRAEIETE